MISVTPGNIDFKAMRFFASSVIIFNNPGEDTKSCTKQRRYHQGQEEMKGTKWSGGVTGDDRGLKGDVDRMILEGCASKMGCVYPGASGSRPGASGADMGAEDKEASNAVMTDCDGNLNCAAREVFMESSAAQHAALNEKTLAQIAAIMRDEALAPALKQRYTQVSTCLVHASLGMNAYSSTG
jgi:hypothetical protein